MAEVALIISILALLNLAVLTVLIVRFSKQAKEYDRMVTRRLMRRDGY